MRNLILTIGAVTGALAVSGAAASAEPQPALISAVETTPTVPLLFGRDVAGDANLEQAQFLWGGRNYCWYDGGWHGPGYYWCGYAFRRGFGWGGPVGWHGWSRGGYGGGYRGGGFHGGGYHGGGYGGGFHGGDHASGGFAGGHAGGGGFHGDGGHPGGGGFHGGGHEGGHGGGGGHHH